MSKGVLVVWRQGCNQGAKVIWRIPLPPNSEVPMQIDHMIWHLLWFEVLDYYFRHLQRLLQGRLAQNNKTETSGPAKMAGVLSLRP